MAEQKRIVVLLLCAALLAACSRVVDSRQAVIALPPPLPANCIEHAMEGIFGAGTARLTTQGNSIFVTAFPWEGYIRIKPSEDGQLQVAIELTRVNRYKDDRGSVAAVLDKSAAAIVAACAR